VAKIDSQASRTATFVEDDPDEQFFRPAAPSSPRSRAAQDVAPERRRKTAPPANGDSDDDSFLRARRRVPVRRGMVPVTRSGRIMAGAIVAAALAVIILIGFGIRNFFRDDPRFRVASANSIQILGNSQVTRSELLSVFGADLGHNIFLIPLEQRRQALEQLPWVEHASVMRLLPDQLRVSVVERTPVAFVRQGATIGLVDANGVLLRMPPATRTAKHYSFPVVTGISPKDPLSQRSARMHLYQQFVTDLDSGGVKVSSQLSEVDVSNPEDIWALLPAEGTDIQVHFGDSDFLARYRSYQEHLPEWRQQYPHLTSVDMRYENQAVLDMAKQPSEPAHDGEPHHSAPVKRPAGKPATIPQGRSAAKSPKAAKAKG
jgi:cell division protein FtsQ